MAKPHFVAHRFSRGAAAIALTLAALAAVGAVPGVAPAGHAAAALVATGVDDTLTARHDRTTTVAAPGVLGNDLNLVGSSTAVLVSDVSHGTLALQANGTYSYTPSPGYVGADQFRYRPSGLLSTTATVRITVTNVAPVARPDAYSGPSGATIAVAAPGVLLNDSDADADALTAAIVGVASSGSVVLDASGAFTYHPPAGLAGSATFSYRAWDGIAWSATTTVTLSITPTPPAATPVPTPRASAVPTPAATPRPRATPLPTTSPAAPTPSSSPAPSRAPSGTPRPSAPPTPSGDATSSSSPAPRSSTPPGTNGSGPGSSGGGDGGRLVDYDAASADIDLGFSGVLANLDVWTVPAAVIGGPGLLVLLWIALQTLGASVWIPAARRLREGETGGRRSTQV